MPYTSYKCDYSFIESGYGKINIRFIVSDEYAGLFASNAIDCNILFPGGISDNLETYDGLPCGKTLDFELREDAAMTADDIDALDFILGALDSAEKRYCAVFINPSLTPLIDDMKFCGKIAAQSEAKDLLWSGNNYDSEINALRIWKFIADSLIDSLLDYVSLKELIYGGEGIPGISESWEAANVSDRAGWFLSGNRSTAVHNLVSLEALLVKLAENLSAALENKGAGAFNFVFDRSVLDGKFVPARWRHITYKNKKPRYVYSRETSDSSNRALDTYADDAVQLAIDPAGASDYEKIWINYSLVKTGEAEEYNTEAARDFAFENIDTFGTLLYMLAEEFGMFADFYFSDTETINIKFVGRSGISGNEAYIKDAVSASLEISAMPSLASKLYTGKAFYLANNGADAYICNNCDIPGTYIPSENYNKGTNRRRLLLTISPTQCSVNCKAYDDGETFSMARLPHNHYFLDDGIRKDKVWSGAVSLHTAIYMLVDKRDGVEDENDSYWTPAAKFIIEIDGESREFDTLSNYLNFLKRRDFHYYSAEYIIKVPGLSAFSSNSDGSGASWIAVRTGGRITLGSAGYIVTGEYFRLDVPERILKLQTSGRFDNIKLSFPEGLTQAAAIVPLTYSSDMQRRIHTAFDNIPAGNIVSLRQDGTVENSEPSAPHYGRIYGIAISGAAEGEDIIVQTGNRAYIDGWGLEPGARYYLRCNSMNASNLNYEPLFEKTDSEDLFVSIGIAETAETLNIESFGFQQYLFE